MGQSSTQTLLALLDAEVSTAVCVGEFETGSDVDIVAQLDAGAVVDDLPGDLRADVALVDARVSQESEDLLQLLARLRDVHARSVIAIVPSDSNPSDLAALGFEARKSPSGDGLVVIWDAALANRPREWNNSKHWANPQNFSRYRW